MVGEGAGGETNQDWRTNKFGKNKYLPEDHLRWMEYKGRRPPGHIHHRWKLWRRLSLSSRVGFEAHESLAPAHQPHIWLTS